MSSIILNIENVYKPRADHLRKLWGYYNSDPNYVPVYTRAPISILKEQTETRVHSDFFADIIDMKVGYMGSEIDFISPLPDINVMIDELESINNLTVLNSESIRLSAATGISHRLVYIQANQIYMRNIEPWSVVYEYTSDIFKPTKAYWYYSTSTIEGKETKYCNVYDDKSVSYYVYSVNDYIPSNQAQDGSNQEPHLFSIIPIVPVLNNGLQKGNCDKTIEMMDSYDYIMSDWASEIRQSRLTYLKIWGELNTTFTNSMGEEEQVSVPDWLTKFGTMLFGMDDQGNKYGDAQFLEKKQDSTSIESLLDRYREHIFDQSHSLDIKALTSASSARVFTVKAAMLKMESDASTTEVYFRRSMKIMFQLINQYRAIAGLSQFDPEVDIKTIMQRVFPVDVDTSAKALQILLQVLPTKKAYEISDLVEPIEVEELALDYDKKQMLLPTGPDLSTQLEEVDATADPIEE